MEPENNETPSPEVPGPKAPPDEGDLSPSEALLDSASIGMPGEPEENNPVPDPVDSDPSEASPGATSDSPPIEVPEVPAPNWQLAGEALACITGLFQTKPITPEQGRLAERVIFEIERQVVKFCRFGKFDDFVAPDRVDFEETYRKLLPLSESEKRVCTENIASPDIIGAWTEVIDRGRSYVRSGWPIAIRETPTGPEWCEPSRTDGGRVLSMLEIASDGREFGKSMNRGSLTPSMIDTMKGVFPHLFTRFCQMLQLELASAGQKGRKCPWPQEILIRAIADLSPVKLMTFGPSEKESATPRASEIKIKFDSLLTRNLAVA
jgi:hypothetical protein